MHLEIGSCLETSNKAGPVSQSIVLRFRGIQLRDIISILFCFFFKRGYLCSSAGRVFQPIGGGGEGGWRVAIYVSITNGNGFGDE